MTHRCFSALELLAGRTGDMELRQKALDARARACQHPTWRALLELDLAELETADEDVESALQHVESALEAKGEATFASLLALEDLGKRSGREELIARSLEAQAALSIRSVQDASVGDALGVPRYRRSPAQAADAFLRAGEAHRRRGDLEAAGTLLDQALEHVPNEPALVHARLVVAEIMGDTETSARLARQEIERGAQGGLAASLWLRVAEAAVSGGDAPAALDAVRHALEVEPNSIPARVLELDLLDGGHDAEKLASSLETTAELFENDGARSRYYLLAADAWARHAGDSGGAKAALTQAGMYGAPPPTVARAARMLAAISGDAAWYEESSRRLITAGASEGEQAGLWFELFRARLLRKEADSKKALKALSEVPAGRWLGAIIGAYIAPLADASLGEGADAALQELAEVEDDPAASRAFRLAATLRALAAHRDSDAETLLDELHSADGSDVISATALASLTRQAKRTARAAEVLASSASAVKDEELGAALDLEAGILFWQSGDRGAAVEAFQRASSHAPMASASLLGWALRAADPNSIEARRRALEASAEGGEEGAQALERFALEMGAGGDRERGQEALDALATSDDEDLKRANLLARALGSDDTERERALEEIGQEGGGSEAIARASQHVRELEAPSADRNRVLETASNWASVDDSVAAAFEWLGAAVGAENVEAEITARRALAERIDGNALPGLVASATLISMIAGNDAEPLFTDGAPQTTLANLELAPPGSDPRRRTAALGGVQNAFGDDNATMISGLMGWSQLAAGDADAALESFRAVVEAYPDEVIGWEGLRAAAEVTGDRVTVAEAAAALGDAVADDARGAELWEYAAFTLIDDLDDLVRGEFALSRAVDRDVRRFKSFDKLFRIVRERKDGERLLELIGKRLDVAEDPDEIAKLYWERARVLRKRGDREGALTALENVTLLEPDHVGALALSGEIYLTTGKLPEAAENLARLSTLSDAPMKQRLMSGVAAVDIFENKLDQIDRAIEVLDGLYRSGLSTLPVRERYARAAAKAGVWDKATDVLEHLMHERDSREGRIEAARLAMAIHRDKLNAPPSAAAAAKKLLEESPDDGEALDLVLSGAFDPALTSELLDRGREALVAQLMREPMDPERVDRLARSAAKLDRPAIRQAALGALVALGEGTPEIDHELSILDQRVARVPGIAIDPRALPDLCDPEDMGPIPDLMAAMASTFTEALGPGLAALGVSKKERVDPRTGLPVRNEIAAWAGALGIGDFDLYIGGQDDFGVFGIATEPPSIVIGRGVQAPLPAPQRQAVARELFALRRGSTILRHRDVNDVAALIVASCRIAGYEVPSPAYAMLAEFQRQLTKEVSRKVKKVLPELGVRVAQSGQDPTNWVRAATSSLDRLAAIAAGDVSWVLSGGSLVRGQVGASIEAQGRTSRLLSFVLSPTYLTLRQHLGMGVR